MSFLDWLFILTMAVTASSFLFRELAIAQARSPDEDDSKTLKGSLD